MAEPVTFSGGLSDNQFMEVLSGDLKPGDALITEELRLTEELRPAKDGQKSGGPGKNSGFKVRMF